MSKKAVECLDALVLELTFGRAAPLKTEEDARKLANAMVFNIDAYIPHPQLVIMSFACFFVSFICLNI